MGRRLPLDLYGHAGLQKSISNPEPSTISILGIYCSNTDVFICQSSRLSELDAAAWLFFRNSEFSDLGFRRGMPALPVVFSSTVATYTGHSNRSARAFLTPPPWQRAGYLAQKQPGGLLSVVGWSGVPITVLQRILPFGVVSCLSASTAAICKRNKGSQQEL